MSTPVTDLHALLAAARAGDPQAYRRFLDRVGAEFRIRIRHMLARAGASGIEAEDVLQEMLISVHTRLHTYDPAYPAGAWLHAIARHKVIDALRAAGVRKTLPLEAVEEPWVEPEASRADVLADLERVIAAVPARLRSPFRAVKVDGRPIADVAAEVGLSESALKVGLHRTMKRLATVFGGG